MRQDLRFTNSRIRLDTTNLDKILKQLQRQFFVKVGIMGNKSSRPEGAGQTNADLGLIHEYGNPIRNLPARSWLRMPLNLKLPEIFKKFGQRLINRMTTENIQDIYDELGARAMRAIDDAFSSSGFGFWAPNKMPYAKLRKVRKGRIKMSEYQKLSSAKKKEFSRPLIDTGELRKSVDREVKAR